MKTIQCLSLFFLLFAASCKEESNPTEPGRDYSDLIQSWTNSFEEQVDSIQVYRPSDYRQYAIARFRGKYEFLKDGTCNYLVLSPTDAHYMQIGRWTVISRVENVIGVFDSTGAVYRKMRIVELQQDLLRFVYIN